MLAESGARFPAVQSAAGARGEWRSHPAAPFRTDGNRSALARAYSRPARGSGPCRARHRFADRRARALFITEKAKVLLPTLRNFLDESLCEALTGLSGEEITNLAKALEYVIANLTTGARRPIATQ